MKTIEELAKEKKEKIVEIIVLQEKIKELQEDVYNFNREIEKQMYCSFCNHTGWIKPNEPCSCNLLIL